MKVRLNFEDGREIIVEGNTYEERQRKISQITGCDWGMHKGDRRIKFVPFTCTPLYK